MSNDINDYFKNITSRERAIFEGGITMGALFHQFVGTPISKNTVNSLKNAIKQSLELQPAIEKVDVEIDFSKIDEAMTELDYTGLTGDMLDIKVYSKIDNTIAIIRIKYIEELKYPLMYVEDILEE